MATKDFAGKKFGYSWGLPIHREKDQEVAELHESGAIRLIGPKTTGLTGEVFQIVRPEECPDWMLRRAKVWF